MYFSEIPQNIKYIPSMFLVLLLYAAYPISTFVLLYPTTILAKWLKTRKNISRIWKYLILIVITLTTFIGLIMLHEILVVAYQEEAYQRGMARLSFLFLAFPTMILVLVRNLILNFKLKPFFHN